MNTDQQGASPRSGAGLTRRQDYARRLEQLKLERQPFLAQWRELAAYVLPWALRLGGRRESLVNSRIINNTATLGHRVLASGLMAGLSSPARPWFRLGLARGDLMESGPVRQWLAASESVLAAIFARSNFYNVAHQIYAELGVFGTGAMHIDEDPGTGIRCYHVPVGGYCLSLDARLEVDTFYRETSLSVRQLVEGFGAGSVSAQVLGLHESGNLEAQVDIVNVIEPNPRGAGPGKAFRSVWFEAGGDPDRFLKESGFAEFPIVAPRWDIIEADIYGRPPAADALGDIKALQLEELRKAQAIDKMSNPPMVGHPDLKAQAASVLPGGITFAPFLPGGQPGFRPVYQVDPRIGELMADIGQVERRIEKAFYVDLFLMLANSDRRQITATEVAERHEEKLLVLGPVVERLQGEMLKPVIERTFAIALRQGLLPAAPPELRGTTLDVEFISVLAQAQKLVAVGGIERYVATIAGWAGLDPRIADKVDLDQAADELGGALGVSPRIMVSDEIVAGKRAQKEREAEAAQQMAMLQQMGGLAESASRTDLGDGENLLGVAAKTLAPALAAPQGG